MVRSLLDRGAEANRKADNWAADVPGEVTDLAFAAGRLFVVADAGAIVCFAPSR